MIRFFFGCLVACTAAVAASLQDATPIDTVLSTRNSVFETFVPAVAGTDVVGIDTPTDGLGPTVPTRESRPELDQGAVDEEEQTDFVGFTELIQSATPLTSNDEIDDEQNRQSCTSFEANTSQDPRPHVQVSSQPWLGNNRNYVCKLYVEWRDLAITGVCSGSLFGEFHLLTARHCTYNPCSNDLNPIVRVACGFGRVDGTTEYAHFGTAMVLDCLRYQAFDDSLTCSSGSPSGVNRDYDIQVCRLDRSLSGVLGQFGFTTDPYSSLDILGYPASSSPVRNWLPNAGTQRFYRRSSVSITNQYFYRLDGEWIFSGESGGPYYAPNTGQGDLVSAVHSGGPTGCSEFGTRINPNFFQDMRKVLGLSSSSNAPVWASPPAHCQLIYHPVDLFNLFSGSFAGVAAAGTPFGAEIGSSLNVNAGNSFQIRISLFNVGTISATGVRVRIFASTSASINTSDHLLDDFYLPTSIPSDHVHRHIRDVQANWGSGDRFIGAIWTSGNGCRTDDGDRIVIGRVFTNPVPTPHPTPRPTFHPTRHPTPHPIVGPTPHPTPFPTRPPTPNPTPNPVPPPPSGTTIIICFSSANFVEVRGKGRVPMAKLEIGDHVKTKSSQEVYSQVFAFAHKDPVSLANYLQIHTNNNDSIIEISELHMVYVNGQLSAAKSVVVGDRLGEAGTVTRVTTVNRHGLYAPLTLSGDILVSGVHASNYVTLLPTVDITMQAHFYQASLFPLRTWCWWSIESCKDERYDAMGVSTRIGWFIRLVEFVSRSNTAWIHWAFVVATAPIMVAGSLAELVATSALLSSVVALLVWYRVRLCRIGSGEMVKAHS